MPDRSESEAPSADGQPPAAEASRTQELVEANATLIQAVRFREDLLAGVSHELRTPVATLLGQTQALREGVYGVLNEGQSAALARIERSGEHLLSLISDLLDVSRPEEISQILQRRWATPASMLRGCVELLGDAHLQKGVRLEVLDEAAGWEVFVDARRVQQLLLNLMDNAVKFTGPGGKVQVSARWAAAEGALVVEVRDDGLGISPEHQARVFEPFIQLWPGLSRPHGGVGLGLTLARAIARLHGGQLSVDSALGEGSTFSLTLPVDARRAETAPEPPPMDVASSPLAGGLTPLPRVALAVEGAEGAALHRALSRAGHPVGLLSSGAALLEDIRVRPPGAIVLALGLQGGDGLNALRQVRALAPLADVPVLALMGPDDELDLVLGAGADLALSATTAPEHLSRAVRSLLTAAQGGSRRSSLGPTAPPTAPPSPP